MRISKSMKNLLEVFPWAQESPDTTLSEAVIFLMNGSQSRNDSGYFMSSANKGNLFKRLEHET